MPAHHLDLAGGSKQWIFVIGAGIFATTLAQSGSLDLPLRNLLVNQFQITVENPCAETTGTLHTISKFFGIVAFPWYFKIVVGIFSDSFPLFGTLRRHYVLLSATAAAALWLLAGYVDNSYLSLLITITAMETMLVVGSTVMGALLVEVGQRLDAAGRLVAARVFVEGGCAIVAGPLAGVLAGLPFETAAAVGAGVAFSVVPVAFIWLREPASTKDEVSAVADGIRELRDIVSSRPLWIAAAFIFVASIPQTFPTPLWDFQKCNMNLSDITIGYLRGAAGVGSVLAAVIYGSVYRRLTLRALIACGIIGSSFGSFGYLFYHSLPAAIAIDTANGVLTTLWVLAMMEMAVWVAPSTTAAAAFALLMGASNAGSAFGDYVFSQLVDWRALSFAGIALFSAVGTALTAVLLLWLPQSLFGPPER